MGVSAWQTRRQNMKIAILVALVAFVAAEPEADADAYYGYGLGYYGGYGLGYSGLGYGGYGYAGLGPYGLGYHGISSYSPSASVHVGGHAAAGRYVANSAGVVHVAKRSADAEPEAE